MANNSNGKISQEIQTKIETFKTKAPVNPTNIEYRNGRARIIFRRDGAELIYVISKENVVARFWKPDGNTVEDAAWLDSLDLERVGKDIHAFCESPKIWLWKK